MKASKLRHRITIQELTGGRDADGDPIAEQWQDKLTVWASLEPLSVKDVLSAQTANSKTTARAVIRYRDGVTSAMRVLHRGQVYMIDGDPLPDPVSGREYLTLMLSAGVNADGR